MTSQLRSYSTKYDVSRLQNNFNYYATNTKVNGLSSDIKRLQNNFNYYATNSKVSNLDSDIKGLKRQLNGNPLSCSERTTNWEPRSAAHIMFLDRQNVKCPTSYFLTRFRLQREGDYDSAKVRYSYTCCYLWVY